MGWESREYGRNQGGSRFGRLARRIFGDLENPMSWSVPLYTAWGIRVRVHLVFVIMIAWELIFAGTKYGIGFQWTAMFIGALFLLVLLHEYGHCIACRWSGGSADQILMWPLGGLAYCAPASGWKPHLITTIGGPAVNAILWPLLGGALCALVPSHAWYNVLVVNPLNPVVSLLATTLRDGSQPYWLYFLWWVYLTNAVLFLFNMLIPMFPMDGARVAHELIWSRKGERRATQIMVKVGLVTAVALFFTGMATGAGRLMGLAVFGGVICWGMWQQLKLDVGHPSIAGYDFDRGFQGMPGAEEDTKTSQRRARAEQKRREQEQDEQAELDRILAKIARSGMGSLTHSEKRWLELATERRRRA